MSTGCSTHSWFRNVSHPTHRISQQLCSTGGEDGENHYKKCKKILSPKAKYIISKRLEAGDYADRADEREPPFMAPSTNPEDYSKVCSNAPSSSSRV
jgi:hypothetical protein